MNFVDLLQVIELNPTELCNLKCSFCPRATFYPNQNLNIDLNTIRIFRKRLDEIKFSNVVSFTGRGEPTLYKQFTEASYILLKDKKYKLKINTNGKNIEKYLDVLKEYDIVNLSYYENNIDEFLQLVDKYSKYSNFNFYYKPPISLKEDFSLRYTNRAGSFERETDNSGFCDMVFDKLFIDYNGDYKLCCQDWKDHVSLGNIKTESIEKYLNTNTLLQKYRAKLVKGERIHSPCSNCDYKNNANKQLTQKYKDVYNYNYPQKRY